jgi:hypothetical protein
MPIIKGALTGLLPLFADTLDDLSHNASGGAYDPGSMNIENPPDAASL